MNIDHDKHTSRVDPKVIIKLYDSGKFPSAVAAELNISLWEVLDVLEKRRRDAEPHEAENRKI
jgi:hypothetical protein